MLFIHVTVYTTVDCWDKRRTVQCSNYRYAKLLRHDRR